MSADPVGGYILFPSTLAYADLIATTLKAMELAPDERAVRLPGDDGPFLPEEGYPFSTDEPPEQALALLAQKKRGVIEGKGAKTAETYWFEPVVEGYPVVTIWYEAWSMNYEKWPDDIESFARRWLQFCEQGQALFGYFSPFSLMFERNHLEETEKMPMTRPIPADLLDQLTKYEQDFTQLVWEDVDLHECDLSGRSLSGATMPGSNLDRAILRGTILNDANLYEASLVGAILDGAWLVKAEAWKAKLSAASLRELEGTRLHIIDADLRECNLTRATLIKAEFNRSLLEHTNFNHANLRRASFLEAHLEHADMSYANLRDSTLVQANLAHATLTGAALREARLAGAQGLDSVQVDWIDIGEENSPERLEGEIARRWLREEAAKPTDKWWKR